MTLPSHTPPASDKTTITKLEIVFTIAASFCSYDINELLEANICFLVSFFDLYNNNYFFLF